MQNQNSKLAAIIAHFGRAGAIVLSTLAIAVFMQLGMGGSVEAQAPDIKITTPAGGELWFENENREVRWDVPSSLFAGSYDEVDAVYYLEQTGDSRPIGAQRVTKDDIGKEIVFSYVVGQSGELGVFYEGDEPPAHIRMVIEPFDNIESNGFSVNSEQITLGQIQHDGTPFMFQPKVKIKAQISYEGYWLQKQEQDFQFDLSGWVGGGATIPVTAELIKDGTAYVLGTFSYANGQDLSFTFFTPANFAPGEAVLRLRPGNPTTSSYIDGRHTKLVHILPGKTITITSPVANANLYRGENGQVTFTASRIPQGHFYTYPENMDVELVTIDANGEESQKHSITLQGYHPGSNGVNIVQVWVSPDAPQYANDSTTYLRVKSRLASNPSTDALINIKVVDRAPSNQDLLVDINHADAIPGHGLVFTPLSYDATAKPQVEAKVWIKNGGIEGVPATKLWSSAAFATEETKEEMKGNTRTLDVPAIPAGESVLVSLGSYEADTYTFYYMLQLDAEQDVYESNEENNVTQPTFVDLTPYQGGGGGDQFGVQGTYFSKPYAVTTDSQRWSSWTNFRAVYNDQLNSEIDTDFAIGFFNSTGQNLCTLHSCNGLGFDANGYYLVQVEKSYNPDDEISGEFDLSGLNNISWMNQVDSVKIRIKMFSGTYAEEETNQPWVQSVDINYTSDALGEVGLVFGPQLVNIQRGSSTAYTFDMNRIDPTFTGRVNWSVVNNAPDPRITTTPSTGSVVFGTENTMTASFTIAAAADIPVDTQYPFTIRAIPEDPGKAFRALEIGVTVRVGSNSLFSLIATPLTGSVVSGDNIAFAISATRQPGFTAAIDLTDNILSTFGSDVELVTYDPATKQIPEGSNGPVTITIASADDVTNHNPRSFKVMGSSGTELAEVSIQLTITDPNNPGETKDISVELTAPIEWGLTQGGQRIPNVFTFRLYNSSNFKVFEVANLSTDAQDKATVAVTDLNIGGVYRGFVRSTRHLWREASVPITVAANQDSYPMSFTRLLVGDIDPNNTVNAQDVSTFTLDWGKTGTLVSDFDGNGSVNALDIVAIFSNYFKLGSPLPQ